VLLSYVTSTLFEPALQMAPAGQIVGAVILKLGQYLPAGHCLQTACLRFG
jgi:hypothetical protein